MVDAAPGRLRSHPNLLIAAAGVLLFAAVSVASGKIAIDDGLGWDGRAYAAMVTQGIRAGQINTQTRPLIPLLARLVYSRGVSVIDSFRILNVVYAAVLYLAVAMLLERDRVPAILRAAVVGSLALCVATSKMFGFYPVQVDLGALAIVTGAFYFASMDRRLPGAVGAVLAAASREFGVVVAIYGIHRALRQRQFAAVLFYVPALVAAVAVRLFVQQHVASSPEQLTLGTASDNLRWWTSPAFAAVFAYFVAAVFGGVSALLIARPLPALARLRREPELITALLVVLGLSAAGSFDVWRYLAFALPVVIVLAAETLPKDDPIAAHRVAVAMVAITVVTQQPFARMDETAYFRDWFPLYLAFGDAPAPGLLAEWIARTAVLLLCVVTMAWVVRPRWRAAGGM